MGTSYSHLTLDDRRIVFRLQEAKLGVQAIASRLGCHPSTIYRELKRNWHKDAETPRISGYYPTVAQEAAARRRYRLGKLQRDGGLAASIVARLRDAWSPEQIARRLRQEGSPLVESARRRFINMSMIRQAALETFIVFFPPVVAGSAMRESQGD